MTREEIKDLYGMRDIVGRYGFQPNRAGFISCPFHEGDRQASMKLYDKDYHCFSCQENGDIFDFVQRMEGIDFKTAFAMLGGTYITDHRAGGKMRAAEFARKKAEMEVKNRAFRQWKRKRSDELSCLLRLLDQLIPTLPPLSDEWCAAINMAQISEYKYNILSYGTKVEQEGMMELDG